MRMFGFHAPQERIEPRLWTSVQNLTNANAGRFLRNAVLDGPTYGGYDMVPAFLKTRDAIHPLCGTQSIDGDMQSCYGGVLDSVNSDATKAAARCVIQPWNTGTTWAPGGNGVDKWLAVKLPEGTLVERYIVASTSTTCPLSWKLQGSLDGSAWADIHTVESSGTWTATREEKIFTIPEETRGTYLWYRLYITASNATTMSISTFRLLRPQSVCDEGQLLLDASAANPLILSFMDGFSGTTPVDHSESLSAGALFNLSDMNCNIPQINTESWAHASIVATRTGSGSVTISLEASNQSNALFNNAGMKSNIDGGFKITSPSGGDAGVNDYKGWCVSRGTATGNSKLSRVDGEPFYVSRVVVSTNYSLQLIVFELDGTTLNMGRKTLNQEYVLNRQVLGLHKQPAGTYSSVYVYSTSSPFKYRISSGKLYQQETNISDDWTAVQKIKLGTCDIYNGEIVNVNIRAAQTMQWQVDGNYLFELA